MQRQPYSIRNMRYIGSVNCPRTIPPTVEADLAEAVALLREVAIKHPLNNFTGAKVQAFLDKHGK